MQNDSIDRCQNDQQAKFRHIKTKMSISDLILIHHIEDNSTLLLNSSNSIKFYIKFKNYKIN